MVVINRKHIIKNVTFAQQVLTLSQVKFLYHAISFYIRTLRCDIFRQVSFLCQFLKLFCIFLNTFLVSDILATFIRVLL